MICFTHFDLVEGDNLPDDQAKMNHVLYALSNLLDKVGQDVDQVAEEALERFLQGRVFFAGNLNRLDFPSEDNLTHTHLNNLVDAVEATTEPDQTDLRLFYKEEYKLPLGIQAALKTYHQNWRALLGLEARPDIPKEHWARIKALTRHIGYLDKDQYASLQPAANLFRSLSEQISRYLDKPHHTIPRDVDNDVRQAAISRVKNRVTTGLLDWIRDVMISRRSSDWQAAYGFSGLGSAVKRAHAVRQILETAAPLIEDLYGANGDDVFAAIQGMVSEAIQEVGGRLVHDAVSVD